MILMCYFELIGFSCELHSVLFKFLKNVVFDNKPIFIIRKTMMLLSFLTVSVLHNKLHRRSCVCNNTYCGGVISFRTVGQEFHNVLMAIRFSFIKRCSPLVIFHS